MLDINKTHFKTIRVDNTDVFYREAGHPASPVLLLLHGFPTSSHMYRNLIPLLSDKFRVIAPDLPGFGSTIAAPRGEYTYTFDSLYKTIENLNSSTPAPRPLTSALCRRCVRQTGVLGTK